MSSVTHNTVTPDVATATDDYRSRFAGAVGEYFLAAQAAGVRRLLGGSKMRPMRVLEVGGGHGQLTPYLLQWGHEVCVQGSDESCLRQLGAPRRLYPERLTGVTSSLWALPFEDRHFDAVIALRVTAHVERWRELLAEMARVARQHVLIDYASQIGWNALTPLLFQVKRGIEGNTRPYFCYRGGELRVALRKLGLSDIAQRKQFFLPMGLHRLVNSPAFSATAERLSRIVGLTALCGSPVLMRASRAAVSNRVVK